MGYASLLQVREWLTEPAGTCDADRLNELANDCRQFLYNEYDGLSLFRDAVECFEVQQFCEGCSPCGNGYRGVTLPRYMQQVEAMWYGSTPVPLQSSWREYQTGLANECDCQLEKFDVPGTVPCERDISILRPQRLKVLCSDNADTGKEVIISGTDVFHNREAREVLTLQPEYRTTDAAFEHFRQFQKPATVGRVVIADETGRILSIYAPDETIPAYRRIKITGLPSHCAQVNIRASRRFVPLYNDFDVVETDNKLGLVELAHYFRLNRRTDKDVNVLQAMKLHIGQARAHFAGEQSRDLGKGTQGEFSISSPTMARHQLRRTRMLGRRF